MSEQDRRRLRQIHTFPALVKYLKEDLNWPIEQDSFEDLTFDWEPEELGLDPSQAAKIEYIKQLRPLRRGQPKGVFFVKFDTRRLPVVALRRVLGRLVIKKRATASAAERPLWDMHDLVFISSYGDRDERQLSFAYFQDADDVRDLPRLKILGWDNRDAPLHLDEADSKLRTHFGWPGNVAQLDQWRQGWSNAFDLRHREVVTTAKELSIRLATLARTIRDRIKSALAIETERGPLTKLMKAFQQALVSDQDADGFADMYAQTIAYGLLSARIADPHNKTVDDFAAHMRTNPFLRELMETFLKVGGRRGKAGGPGIDFDELGVAEVVDLLDQANIEAVVRDFGDRNRQEDPVIHFYESFLSSYNKELKVQRGVFYTPQPVVSYIVRSVHELLQTKLGLTDGLADTATWGEMRKKHPDLKLPPLTDDPGEKGTLSPDEPFVQILDPATGTATFLVEVIEVIFQTLAAQWERQRLTDAQQLAAWNDYVPKHLLPRLHGFELMMAPYAIAHMKIGLKLIETGYRFSTEQRAEIYLTNALEPWMKQLPLIGFDALAHEAAAVNEIKRDKRFTVVIGNPPYQGFSANTGEHATRSVDVYRYCDGKPLGERNPSWLLDDYVKFLRLGQHAVQQSGYGVLGMITNSGYIDNPTFRGMRESFLNGFSGLSLLNLNGDSKKKLQSPDGSQDENIFAIQQGVAVGLFVRGGHEDLHRIEYSELWGSQESKLAYLGGRQSSSTTWTPVEPHLPFLLFRPTNVDVDSEFRKFTSIKDLFEEKGWGFKTRKDYLLVAFDRETVLDRFTRIAKLSAASARKEFKIEESEYWNFEAAHEQIPKNPDESIRPVLFRPFDVRFVFYEKYMIERGDHKFELMSQMFNPNIALITVRRNESNRPFDHVFCTRLPAVLHSVSAKEANFFFPFLRYDLATGLRAGEQRGLFTSVKPEPNCAMQVVSRGNISNFNYIYAILFSNRYRARYAEQLRIDFPRVPLTENLELFRALARCGEKLTALHLLESPQIDKQITEFIGGKNCEVEKVSWSNDAVWIDKAKTRGFRRVREDVWDFQIGGYQVCEKWLKDRKGRRLLKADIEHYQKIIVALSETLQIMREIDAVIEKHGGWPGAFQAGEVQSTGSGENLRKVAEPNATYGVPREKEGT